MKKRMMILVLLLLILPSTGTALAEELPLAQSRRAV